MMTAGLLNSVRLSELHGTTLLDVYGCLDTREYNPKRKVCNS